MKLGNVLNSQETRLKQAVPTPPASSGLRVYRDELTAIEALIRSVLMAPAPGKAHFEVHAISSLCLETPNAKHLCVLQRAC